MPPPVTRRQKLFGTHSAFPRRFVEAADAHEALARFCEEELGTACYEDTDIPSACGCVRHVSFEPDVSLGVALLVWQEPCDEHSDSADTGPRGKVGAREDRWV